MEKTTITLQLSDSRAKALASFCQRVGYKELESIGQTHLECYHMKEAIRTIHEALSNAGFNPK
jgi:hypothetical protein